MEPSGQAVFEEFPRTLAGDAGGQTPFPTLAVPAVPGGKASGNSSIPH